MSPPHEWDKISTKLKEASTKLKESTESPFTSKGSVVPHHSNYAKPPATLPRDGAVLTKRGLATTSKAMVADAMLKRNLEWAKTAHAAFVNFLLDKSGSMASQKGLVIESFNEYLNAIRQWPSIAFSFYQFDSHSYDTICEARPVQQVPWLTDNTYHPLGGTPLYDSIIETIHRVEKMTVMPFKPRIVVCIQTDGSDTSGRSPDVCRALIRAKIRDGWQFQFLGASLIDAYDLSSKLGIAPEATMSYDAIDTTATKNAFLASAKRALDFAKGSTNDANYTKQDRIESNDTKAPPLLLK